MAVHAAGESGPAGPGTTAVVLQVEGQDALLRLSASLEEPHTIFFESDPPYVGQAMALGLLSPQGKLNAFSHLRLWRPR